MPILTIVSANQRFIQSAAEIFTGFPATVRITQSCDISINVVYIIPSDSYGNIYSSKQLDHTRGHEEYIQQLWIKPRYTTQPLWYIKENILYIVCPCLNLGLFTYADGSRVPYDAFRSSLMLVRMLSTSHTIEHVVIPALCCDPGGIDPEISSLQMCQAWGDFSRLMSINRDS